MTLKFSAKITITAQDKTRSIFDSINIDDKFYPDNPVKTRIEYDDAIKILVSSAHLTHLRANLNSTLRLVFASYDSIESVK